MRRLVIAVLVLGGCGDDTPKAAKAEWVGAFYPDRNNLSRWENGGPFQTLQDCEHWAREMGRRARIDMDDYDFECTERKT